MNRLILIIMCSVLSRMAFAGDVQLQQLELAQQAFRSATNSASYVAAAEQFEILVQEEGIRNGRLFYNLGNCWFLSGDVGKSILNYRRAQRYLSGDENLQNNLNIALENRMDLIPEAEPSQLNATLFGWHYGIPLNLRWWSFASIWFIFWACAWFLRRSGKRELLIATCITGFVSLALLVSLIVESITEHPADAGVIIASEVLARKGDGERYAPAFLDPLHAGTEFRRIEAREHWWQIQLPDGQSCWIPSRAAEMVSLP